MSHFNAVFGARAAFLPAAAFACGLALASPGHATQYFLQSDSMDTSRTAHINGPGGASEYVYIGPITFKTYQGTGATPATGALSGPSDLLAFCVDIFHNITLGGLDLKYDDVHDLTTNSNYQTGNPFVGGSPLSKAQVVQVGRLVNYGALLYASAPHTADTVDRLAGLQGAIWQVINPTYSVVSGNGALDSYIAAFSGANYLAGLSGYGAVHSGLTFISETGKYGANAAHQSFAFGAVPEPATWTLLIGGFGFTGVMLRRSRQRLVKVRF
ncbi:PEPxxWA-CTERM sorting domain-containing protein [Phenylobacterium sp.]|uniref:PEPxxWA-CTERM sorting domain-containing protein n=1 Tax=Phenylobacterium sp. TaxID=1871053 RepID=UPI0025EB5EED|nr:PEPxxWA-CTERM sorting domain-containing protein [Phenylobacterium sp.]